MTESEIAQLIAVMQAAWPERNWKGPALMVYQIGLDDIPYEAANAAVGMLIKRSTFCPSPAEIRQVATESLAADIPTVDQALGELQEALIRYWPHQTPAFSHPLIANAVRAIGWRQISESERPGVERAHFRDVYTSMRESAVERVIRDPLGRGADMVAFPTPERTGFRQITSGHNGNGHVE